MEPQLDNQPVKSPEKPTSESARKHVLSFASMILFTAIAFLLVATSLFDATTTVWIITILAVIQVVLQLFTFMHLDQKGQQIPIIFMAIGIFIALMTVIGIILM